jgi:photosystem II stability/assembly factor-like uncharacterized protein
MLVALWTYPAGAAVGAWSGGGPEGGEVLDLPEDPDLADVLYVRTAANGIFRSADAGATWERANAGLPARLSDFTVAGGDVLFAASRSASVWRSLDGGTSWHPTGQPLPEGLLAVGVAADPSAPGTVYVAAREGGDTRILRSEDFGDHWTAVGSHLQTPLELAMTPLRPGSLLLSTSGGGLERSEDGGRTWTRMDPANHWRALAIDARSQRLVAVRRFAPYLWESLDDGQTWHVLADLDVPEWFEAKALAMDPQDPDRLTIAFQYHLWESADGGLTWEGTEPPGSWVLLNDLLVLGSSTTERRMLLTPEGIYQGPDGYGELSVEGLEARAPDFLWAAAKGPDAVAAGSQLSGPWLSVNGGARWRPHHEGLDAHGFWNVAFAGTPNASTLYVGSTGGLWSSRLGGRWQPIEIDPALGNITVVEVLPSGRILIARFGTSTLAFASDDGGRSWTPYYTPTEAPFSFPLDLSIDPTNEGIGLVASLEEQASARCIVDRTTDGGGSWERVLEDEPGFCTSLRLERDPSSPDTVYLLSRLNAPSTGNPTPVDALLRSLDGGATWEPIGSSLPCFGAVAVDPLSSDAYVGCDGIYVSRDLGITWEAFDASGLPADVRFISALAAVPDPRGTTLYAGTNAGIYSYTLVER